MNRAFIEGIEKAQQKLSEAMTALVVGAEPGAQMEFVVEALEAISSAEAVVFKGYRIES
jgi:hypothetical protein